LHSSETDITDETASVTRHAKVSAKLLSLLLHAESIRLYMEEGEILGDIRDRGSSGDENRRSV